MDFLKHLENAKEKCRKFLEDETLSTQELKNLYEIEKLYDLQYLLAQDDLPYEERQQIFHAGGVCFEKLQYLAGVQNYLQRFAKFLVNQFADVKAAMNGKTYKETMAKCQKALPPRPPSVPHPARSIAAGSSPRKTSYPRASPIAFYPSLDPPIRPLSAVQHYSPPKPPFPIPSPVHYYPPLPASVPPIGYLVPPTGYPSNPYPAQSGYYAPQWYGSRHHPPYPLQPPFTPAYPQIPVPHVPGSYHGQAREYSIPPPPLNPFDGTPTRPSSGVRQPTTPRSALSAHAPSFKTFSNLAPTQAKPMSTTSHTDTQSSRLTRTVPGTASPPELDSDTHTFPDVEESPSTYRSSEVSMVCDQPGDIEKEIPPIKPIPVRRPVFSETHNAHVRRIGEAQESESERDDDRTPTQFEAPAAENGIKVSRHHNQNLSQDYSLSTHGYSTSSSAPRVHLPQVRELENEIVYKPLLSAEDGKDFNKWVEIGRAGCTIPHKPLKPLCTPPEGLSFFEESISSGATSAVYCQDHQIQAQLANGGTIARKGTPGVEWISGTNNGHNQWAQKEVRINGEKVNVQLNDATEQWLTTDDRPGATLIHHFKDNFKQQLEEQVIAQPNLTAEADPRNPARIRYSDMEIGNEVQLRLAGFFQDLNVEAQALGPKTCAAPPPGIGGSPTKSGCSSNAMKLDGKPRVYFNKYVHPRHPGVIKPDVQQWAEEVKLGSSELMDGSTSEDDEVYRPPRRMHQPRTPVTAAMLRNLTYRITS